MNTMKYETPDLTELTRAANAIQVNPKCDEHKEKPLISEVVAAYEDWE